MMKFELSKLPIQGCAKTKENLTNKLVDILHKYRVNCAGNSSPTQLILPDALKMLPCYLNSLLKSPACKLLDTRNAQRYNVDEKYYWIYKIVSGSLNDLVRISYPRVFKISDVLTDVSSFILI